MSGASLVAAGKTFSNTIGTIPQVWTPANLFIDKLAYRGAWFDASDLTTLFQDTAGTTPVTTAGQTVGLMKDKSGNGNHLTLTNATLGSDGTLFWIVFDGSSTDAQFVASGNSIFSFSGYCMATMGMLLDSIGTFKDILHVNDGSNVTRFGLSTQASSSQLEVIAHRQTFATETNVNAVLAKPNGAHVWTAFAKFANGVTSLTRDKTVASGTGTLSSTGVTDGNNSTGVWIGNYSGVINAAMQFYGAILLSSELDISSLQSEIETWVGSKVGLTI